MAAVPGLPGFFKGFPWPDFMGISIVPADLFIGNCYNFHCFIRMHFIAKKPLGTNFYLVAHSNMCTSFYYIGPFRGKIIEHFITRVSDCDCGALIFFNNPGNGACLYVFLVCF